MGYRDEKRESDRSFPDRFHNQQRGPDSDLVRHVRYVSLNKLKSYQNHARLHSKRKIQKLARSIRRFGIVVPLLADSRGTVIDGHAQLAAARHIGLASVPVIYLEHLSETEVRALRLALNRLAEEAEWSKEKLALEFQCLIEIDLDVALTGFEMPEIDLAIDSLEPSGTVDEADRIADFDLTEPIVSRPGDRWQLGRHSIICGDATDSASYEALLAGTRAQLVFTDPPYNVPVGGHVCGLGAIRHAEFPMAAGEMSGQEFIEFLAVAFKLLTASSKDGSIHYICMDWRHIAEILEAGRRVYSELKNLCVWNKTNGGMGSLYRSKHELVFVFKNGTAPHINNVELGRHGRYRSNVWDYAGVNTVAPDRLDQLAMHPTVKPIALVADAIKDCSRRGHLVLDPFLGSGTTIIACERTGRVGAGMELDPRYVDVTVARWEALTAEPARHVGTGLTFDRMRDSRRREPLLLPPPPGAKED